MSTIPGGAYRAQQNADGTWNIFDVPTYPAHERKLPTGYRDGELQYKIFKVDTAWLEKTLSYHKFKRDEESFLYPLHINHHEYCGGSQGEQVLGAGFHMPRRIGKIKLDGKETDVMFEDLIGVPPEVFALIEKGQLPYCSVEVLNIAENVLSSLSLMQHHVPYFAFPLITIGAKEYHPTANTSLATASFAKAMESAAAYSRSYEGGSTMPKPEDDKDSADKSKEVKPGEAPAAPAAAPSGAAAGGLEGKLDVMISMLTKLLSGAAATPPPDAGGISAPVPAAASKAAANEGALQGEVAALRARLDSNDRKEALKAKSKQWAAELAPYNLGVDVESQLFTMATDPQRGEAAAVAYVEAVKKNVAPMPPPAFAAAATAGGTPIAAAPTGAFPKEVLAYQKDGVEAMNRAYAAYKAFEEAKSFSLLNEGDTLESFIKNQMREVYATPKA